MLLLPDALRKVLLPFAGLLTKIALWQRSATPPRRAKSSLELTLKEVPFEFFLKT